MRNVIAYYRVATERQRRSGLGIEAQRSTVHRFAQAEGLTILSEYSAWRLPRRKPLGRSSGTGRTSERRPPWGAAR